MLTVTHMKTLCSIIFQSKRSNKDKLEKLTFRSSICLEIWLVLAEASSINPLKFRDKSLKKRNWTRKEKLRKSPLWKLKRIKELWTFILELNLLNLKTAMKHHSRSSSSWNLLDSFAIHLHKFWKTNCWTLLALMFAFWRIQNSFKKFEPI